MTFVLAHTLALLERTPETLRAWLHGLPEPWVRGDEGPSTWSPFDIVGHLIHGEKADWIPRLRLILEHGVERTFEPFDRFAQAKDSIGMTLNDLLDEFAALRFANVQTVRSLRLAPDQLELRGRHPELGPVALRQLLATWAVHDLNHLAQIARAMAAQYRGEVGPWKAYLRILHA